MSIPGWPPGVNGVVIVPWAGQRNCVGPCTGTAGSFGAEDSAKASRRASKRQSLAETVRILPGVKRLAAIAVVVALAAAGCGKKKATTTVGAIGQTPTARAATPEELRNLSEKVGHPVYWLGEQSGHTYELTQLQNGRIFVRYLPHGVPIGSQKAIFTIVGTYPVPNAFNVQKKLAKKSGELSFAAPHDGLAVFSTTRPTNIYLAYPGSNLQIEVFDPSPQRARNLIITGRVVPVS